MHVLPSIFSLGLLALAASAIVLGGAMPLSGLDELISQWIAERKANRPVVE
ncbi:MAG TPA: hypothetical protein VN851_09885 [Thermoanaerobaculia bacterium]|nr:hypothetical protein [Thermoanaerobaculia bacterium]